MNTQIGVYYLQNLKNKRFYIGSSKNLKKRESEHFRNLKNKKHPNVGLQNDYNKYGKGAFKFKIAERLDNPDFCKDVEQEHLNKYLSIFDHLYNREINAKGGGATVLKKPLFLLDLKGNIKQKFESGVECAKYLKHSTLSYRNINTSSIFNREFRVVSPEFFKKNKEVILSWDDFTSLTEKNKLEALEKSKLKKVCTLIDNEGFETVCKTFSKAGELFEVTPERARQVINGFYEFYNGFSILENKGSGINSKPIIIEEKNDSLGGKLISAQELLNEYSKESLTPSVKKDYKQDSLGGRFIYLEDLLN